METISRQKTNIENYNVYVATDGTEFSSELECRKYEESAVGVIRSKVQPLIVSKYNDAWKLMGGYEDHTVVAFKLATQEQADTLKQFLLIEHPLLKVDAQSARREEIFHIFDNAVGTDDLILFGINNDIDNDYYYINSRQNIINNLLSLGKQEEK